MDDRIVKEGCDEIDIENGLVVFEHDLANNNDIKQKRTFFAKIYCGFVRDSIVKGEDRYRDSVVLLKDANLSGDSVDMMKVKNSGQDSVKSVENESLVKEKWKKSGVKKAAKPPRAPRGPSLDAADQKLIREITQLATLKRARMERIKALKKMKAAKSSSSPSSSLFAMVFTVVFCVVILLQGMSAGKSPTTSFQGSPVSAGGAEGSSLIAIQLQHQLNQISSEQHAPSSESHK